MIGFLTGKIAYISDEKVIIDVNGVGYNVLMPSSSSSTLLGIGNEVKIYTHLSVREDAMTLYGFLTADDLQLFKKLIGVSGVGPKFALGVLSVFSNTEVKMAILSNDAKTLSKAPGIGLKSAQKIILELKDKISLDDVLNVSSDNLVNVSNNSAMSDAMNDAVEALIALGYSATDSLSAVRSIDIPDNDDVEAVLKAALKVMKR